ncbi:hypothetical protein L2E82_36010 [Cichorium intybus]|uniref:Uncharacterized protein n=1 Tax=Cichorium intybus TaxID=13427 RepID=A0ACB9BQR3_CICIN|nr:hypothetical protein L2E82_36010 [Cichorium intybus]
MSDVAIEALHWWRGRLEVCDGCRLQSCDCWSKWRWLIWSEVGRVYGGGVKGVRWWLVTIGMELDLIGVIEADVDMVSSNFAINLLSGEFLLAGYIIFQVSNGYNENIQVKWKWMVYKLLLKSFSSSNMLPCLHTENNGNPFSDVLWLAALVQSESELEFSQQVIFNWLLFMQRFCLILISCGSIGFFDHVSPDHHGIHEPVMLIVFKAVFGTILDTDLS